jgi:lipopolysaccharide/colanic/teichoic acid biosynthesis glycosyltransferase
MKIINKIARIHIQILGLAVIVMSLIIIPKVMAMSVEDVTTLQPYGLMALILGIGSAIVNYAQSKFLKIKRAFDIVVSLIAMTVTAPVVLVCCALIKLFSPNGKILYYQNRVGKDGKVFRIYKLRSMQPDAEKNTGAVWANEDSDPRVIPFIGNFLRKSHIDEIPQFYNVLIGEMSVVGPRPERPEIVKELEKTVPEYQKRLAVRPGITGLSQIRHHYDKTLRDVKKKVKLDLLYIRKTCLLGEIGILLRTFIVIFSGKVLH